MTDRDLDRTSKRLLDAAHDVRELERRKRATARSTPEFHQLAERIEDRSRQVFALAAEERETGAEDSPIAGERADQEPADWSSQDAARDGNRRNESGPPAPA